jgi:stage III sporulation protein AF
MEEIKSWIFQLVVIGLGGVIAESLIHRESFARYVRLVVGFLMIMVLVQPVLKLRDSSFDPASWLDADPAGLNAQTDAITRDMQRVNAGFLDEYAAQNMESQIRADIKTVLGYDCRVDVRLGEGGIMRVQIRLNDALTGEDQLWILDRLKENYGISEDTVRFIGG